jgi:hypothetical protein
MRRSPPPFVWFPAALLAVSAATAVLLTQDAGTQPAARSEAYWALHYWRCGFDALSACAGCGLATLSVAEDYTPFGRWVLTGGGFAGACLFAAAAGQALRRAALLRAPGGARLVGGFVLAQLGAAALLGLLLYVARTFGVTPSTDGSPAQIADILWNSVAAYSSSGFVDPLLLKRWPGLIAIAIISILAALGPLATMFVARDAAPAERSVVLRLAGLLAGTWVLAAVLIAAFEFRKPTPMGRGAPAQPAERALHALDFSVPLRELSWPARTGRALIQTVCATGSGIASEPLRDRGVSDGTKLTLGLLVLAGGAPGSVTGGVQALLLLLALRGVAQLLRGRGDAAPAAELRRAHVAAAGLLTLLALAVLCTGGVLLLDAWTASPFQSPATLADAFLDSASAVGGANLSSGVTATLTARNLSSGIRNPTDQYQYGMVWLMLAMLTGRVLPLLILARLAQPPPADARPAAPLS